MTNSMGDWLREAMELRADGRLRFPHAVLKSIGLLGCFLVLRYLRGTSARNRPLADACLWRALPCKGERPSKRLFPLIRFANKF